MGGVTGTYDSGSVAAGSAIDSLAQDFGSADEVTVVVDNGSAVTRALTINFLADDGTVALAITPTAVAATSKAAFAIGHGATARGTEGAAGSVGAIPVSPTRRMQFVLAAGGAGAGRVSARGRY